MKNLSEKSDFEHLWENAFSEAEMAPSDRVWDRIDASLSKEEAGKYRKRVFMYKLLAAASVAFALGIGVFSLNDYFRNQTPTGLTSDNSTATDLPHDNSTNLSSENETQANLPIESNESLTNNSERNVSHRNSAQQKHDLAEKNFAVVGNTQSEVRGIQAMTQDESQNNRQTNTVRGLNPLGIETETSLNLVAMAPEHIYMIPIMPRGASKNMRDSQDLNFIAGLDFSTGLFDPNFGSTASPAFSSSTGYAALTGAERFNDQFASFNTVNKDFQAVRESGKETSPEISLSYGANFGFKISRRIILQTGIAYRKSNSTTTSNAYIEDVSSGKRIPVVASYNYSLEGLSVVNGMNETSLTNQFEFASVPLRGGYMILDKRFNLTVLAGVTSEFFLGNTITGSGDFLESISNPKGDNSPYKDVYFNGSVGTMFGYTIFGNYNITIEPGYRFALNSFTKDDFYLNSYPSAFNLAFGVTYNFR